MNASFRKLAFAVALVVGLSAALPANAARSARPAAPPPTNPVPVSPL